MLITDLPPSVLRLFGVVLAAWIVILVLFVGYVRVRHGRHRAAGGRSRRSPPERKAGAAPPVHGSERSKAKQRKRESRR
ncbi:Integral membrane protein [Ralstonia mannitolilytica]|uniref:hypothetical protein n=2 Tax=Pseudomonadota TaxID=1224 RepID=UPI0007B01F40|nr:hypothetical protein [Ralstonia mannitolilytica]ANA35747.1 hypothetical protein VZ52_20335 [Ralstonia mannitolilytica]MBU9580839.1 hypothetical protein [Ralstonia mannitolilytica]CAJ0687093.1 hypothetical protein R82526_02925 [Ralstonia mannitolilytica]CAJ0804647.1 hypothetical protein R77555_04159 [Ralstonia mannitolilytica]